MDGNFTQHGHGLIWLDEEILLIQPAFAISAHGFDRTSKQSLDLIE